MCWHRSLPASRRCRNSLADLPVALRLRKAGLVDKFRWTTELVFQGRKSPCTVHCARTCSFCSPPLDSLPAATPKPAHRSCLARASSSKDCCDDFEDPELELPYNHPKSSHEQDEKQRGPGGRSNNGLWHEGAKRGTPDVVKRVATPPGGIEGSTGALLFATKNSGIPGQITNEQQQDDLLMLFDRRLGRSIPMNWQPSCTVRVYLPPFEQWENRTGPSFGMRADCTGRNPDGTSEAYWPGMFLLFRKRNGRNIKEDCGQADRARPACAATTSARRTSPSRAGGRWACRSPPTARFTTTPAKASTT